MQSFYGILSGGKTAVIEMAAAAGLPLVGERLSAHTTTTYGVDQLMAHAISSGCERLIVGLGGSASNCFWREFVPVGESLSKGV